MTDDLVKRLRNNCSCNFESTPCGAEEECRNAFEAADRIEQLEAALREISYIHDGNPSPAMAGMPDVDYARFMLGEARRVARAALGEKKDGN
jgi:hypothetical protein